MFRNINIVVVFFVIEQLLLSMCASFLAAIRTSHCFWKLHLYQL